MTKKDFILIANAIADAPNAFGICTRADVMLSIADALGKSNPRFNSTTFIQYISDRIKGAI